MPHITLESTANVHLDFGQFFKELSEKLVLTGNASKMGIKCRAVTTDCFYIIDGNPAYKMVNLLFRLREGRSNQVLEEFSQIGIDLLSTYLKEDIENKTIIISTEIKELKKGIDITKNSIR